MLLEEQIDLLESRDGQETKEEQLPVRVLNEMGHQSRGEDLPLYRVARDQVEQEVEKVRVNLSNRPPFRSAYTP